MKLKSLKLSALILTAGTIACESPKEIKHEEMPEDNVVQGTVVKETPAYDTSDVKSMLAAVEYANGGMDALKALKDVQYDYHYLKPDGKIDISQERYIFDGEYSWAKYTKHEENVSPEQEGDIVQYYDGEKAYAYLDGEVVDDPQTVGTAGFLRQANFMWFCMMFKLNDPGTVAEYQGQKEHEGSTYDIVHLTYDSTMTGKSENDTYVLYIDPDSHMVDYFAFSLPAFGIYEPVLWAEPTYEEMFGVQVITKRMMYAPDPETGELAMMVDQRLSNITFNNDFTKESLAKAL